MSTLALSSFPRAPLFGAAVIIALTLLAALVGRIGGPVSVEQGGEAVVARDLRFLDRPDGTVAVMDARDGAEAAILPVGTNGFLRATLRGLARERRQSELGPETPFRLTLWTGGRLTLEDAATGRRIALEAFGPANVAAFSRLLPARP